MSTLSIIVAAAENNAIGKDNQLLWHLPADLKHFKALTTGHTIIMGRKTFDSIGKPLPHRRSIVISRDRELKIEGAEVVNTLNDALERGANESEIFVIGGAEVYRLVMPFADKIYMTRVHQTMDGDAFFPEIDSEIWLETAVESFPPDEKHALPYTFSIWQRIQTQQ